MNADTLTYSGLRCIAALADAGYRSSLNAGLAVQDLSSGNPAPQPLLTSTEECHDLTRLCVQMPVTAREY